MKLKSIFVYKGLIYSFDINPGEGKVIFADDIGTNAAGVDGKRQIQILTGRDFRSVRMTDRGYYVVGIDPGSIWLISVDPLLTQSTQESIFTDNKDLVEGILDLARDNRENWYIFKASTIHKVDKEGENHRVLVGVEYEMESKDGDGVDARLDFPTCAINMDDRLYFCEKSNHKIRVVDVRLDNEVKVWSLDLIGMDGLEFKRQFTKIAPYSSGSLVAIDSHRLYIIYLDTGLVKTIYKFALNYITDVKLGYNKLIYVSTGAFDMNKSNIWKFNSRWNIIRLLWLGSMKERNNIKCLIHLLPNELIYIIIDFIRSKY
jgi:hypothetical protein